MIFDSDAKRLRFGHVMLVDDEERATFECVGLHFDTRSNRTAPLPDDVQTALKAAQMSKPPEWAGRRVTLEKQ
jgi:acyl-CoA thioesterase FadM